MRPKGADWDAALARWKQLPTDEGATYDRSVTIDADALEPMITYGTNPGMGMPISGAAARAVRDRRSHGARFDRQGAALHGPRRRQAAAGPSHRRGLHRKLHQFPHLRSAHRRGAAEGPQGQPQGARDGGAGIAGSEAPGRSPKGCRRSSAPPAANGASRAAPCASP